jgi:hypothetical protein
MQTIEELQKYVQDKIKLYPELKSEIISLFQLCLDEIEEGGSRKHEIDLCITDIDQTINESLEESKRL